MRRLVWKRAALLGLVLLSGCIEARPLARTELIYPLVYDYKAMIVTWATGYFADPAGLRRARISAPISIEDRAQNPMWLVCVDVDVRGADGAYLGPQRFAFGLVNPLIMSAPQRRAGAALTSADCDKFPLAWTPFPELERIKASPRPR